MADAGGGGGGGGGLGAGLGDLVGGIINLADPGRSGKRYIKDALGQWRELPDPEFDPRDILQGQLYQQGEITPETYEVDPRADVSQISEDPQLREAELRSMYGMEQVGREGLPLVDRLLAEEAQRRTGSEFQRANDSIIADLARRGRAGGGTELAARNLQAGNAAELARGQGADLAMMSVGNRVAALGETQRMAGDTRGADRQAATVNAQMANRFNEWLTGLDTEASRYAAGQRSGTQVYNLGERQRIADANTRERYQSDVLAQGRNDLNQQRLFDARRQRVEGLTGVYGKLGEYANAKQAAKQQNVRSTAGGGGAVLGGILGGII